MRAFSVGVLGSLCFSFALASVAGAEVSFSLVPSVDPLGLKVGDSLTVHVDVSGLTVGQQLDGVSAIVEWDADRFGLPSVTAGSKVPDNPLDDFDFLAIEALETVDVAFVPFSADPLDFVLVDDVSFRFMSFDVTAVAPGAGSFRLGPVGVTQFLSGPPPSTEFLDAVAGASLEFMIAVPEPSSVALLASGVGVLVGAWRRRRRIRQG